VCASDASKLAAGQSRAHILQADPDRWIGPGTAISKRCRKFRDAFGALRYDRYAPYVSRGNFKRLSHAAINFQSFVGIGACCRFSPANEQ